MIEKIKDFLKRKFNIDKNLELFILALTHSSYANEHNYQNYERLEFLGDSVIKLLISNYLYNNFDYDQGGMTKNRAFYEKEETLYNIATKLELDKYILLGHSIQKINKSIISDVLESFIGAYFKTYGFEETMTFFNTYLLPIIKNIEILVDYKTELQEIMQLNKQLIEYKTISTGPSHSPFFESSVLIDGIVYGIGSGNTKKDAEQHAASDALNKCSVGVNHDN